eukprot:sb/3469133/
MASGTRGNTLTPEIATFLNSTSGVPARAKTLANSPDALFHLFSALHSVVNELRFENETLKDTVSKLTNSIATLSVQPPSPDPQKVATLEDRLLKSEAYSGRATAILTGIPETQGEDVVSVVVDTIKEVIPDFSSTRLSTVHRNKKKNNSNKPRSITVVFSKIRDKDNFSDFRNQGPLREKKVGAYHYAPPAILARKRELEDCENVKTVYFDGPVKMFSVKFQDGTIKRRITSAKELNE